MSSPHAVTRHKVYKNLKAKLEKDNDWKEIAKNLAIVYDRRKFPKTCNSINDAFVWATTQQGLEYWSDISRRVKGW